MAQGPGLSTSPPVATQGPGASGELELAECLREGFLQLKLILLWIDYRLQLTKCRDASDDRLEDLAGRCKVLADRLLKEVMQPFLRAKWLPELDQYAERFKQCPAQHQGLFFRLQNGHDELIRQVLRPDQGESPPSRPRLVELIDAALHEKEPPARRPGREAAFALDARIAIENWTLQATALDAWARLERDLIPLEKEYKFGDRLGKLTEELEAALKEKSPGRLSRDAEQLVGRMEKCVALIRSNLGRDAGPIELTKRYEWMRAYTAAGEDWPPRVLADIAECLRSEGGEPLKASWLATIKPAQAPARGASPRAILAEGVLGGLDKLSKVPPPSDLFWGEIESALGRLFRAQATLVRTQALDPAVAGKWRSEVFDGPPGSHRRLRKTGLVLDGDALVRAAEVQVAKDSGSPLAGPLEALRDSKSAGELGTLAGGLRDLLAHSPSLEDKSLTDPDFILIWRVLARASLAPSKEAALVIDELGRLGYRLVPAPAAVSGRPVAPGWVAVVPILGRTSSTPFSPGDAPGSEVVALSRPGRDEPILPTTWLLVPHSWLGREHWLDVLLKHEASLIRLVDASIGSFQPSGLIDLIRGLVAARTQGPLAQPPPLEAGADQAAEIFAAFLRESQRLRDSRSVADRARGEELWALAREFYQALGPPARQRVGIPLKDDLTPDRKALAGEIPRSQLIVEWDASKSDELRIMDLAPGTERSPARVTLATPEGFDDRSMAWVRLPDPGELLGGRLKLIHLRLNRLPAAEMTGLEAIQAEVVTICRDNDALNSLITEAKRGTEGSPARIWLRRLLDDSVIVPWPPLDRATFGLTGSDGLNDRPDLTWDFDEAEAGSIVESHPIVFSTDPGQALVKLSLGRRGVRPWVDAVVDMHRSLGSLPDRLSRSLTPPLDRLLAMTKAALKAGRARPPSQSGLPRVEPFAALLTAHEPVAAATSDEVARRLRGLAGALGRPVHPSDWLLEAPPSAGQVDPSEAVVDADARPDFAPGAPPMGRLILKRFSVGDAPGLYEISCGQAPPHYEALRGALAAAGGAAGGLVALLDTWPASAQGGRLELEAIQFYLEFWDALGTDFRRGRYEEFRAVEGLLASLLDERFGLVKFEPSSIHDHPDGWMIVTAQGPLMTGRVARIGRPGLRTKDHMLRVAALVETE